MKPTTLVLSDAMHDRLEAALQPFEDAYPYQQWQSAGHRQGNARSYKGSTSENVLSVNIKLGLAKAVASAIYPSPESMDAEAYETLKREHPEIIEESLRIGDALLGIADGSGTPGVMLENLPKEGKGFYFLAGIQQLMGDSPDTAYRNERSSWLSFSTKNHAIQHRDAINVSSGGKGIIHLRGMMGRHEGGKPWPTVITSADEIITVMATLMLKDEKVEPSAAAVSQKTAEIEAWFKKPIWHTTADKPGVPALLENTVTGKGVSHLFNFISQEFKVTPEDTKNLTDDEIATCDSLVKYFHQARREASKEEGVMVRPGTMLLWNNLMVFHGAGMPANGKDGLSLPPRELDHLEIFSLRDTHPAQESFGPFSSAVLIKEGKERPKHISVEDSVEELRQLAGKQKGFKLF